MGHFLRASQVAPDIRYQISLINGSSTPDRIALHILIQQLIGVQFWAVRRKEIQLDLLPMGFEPARRLAGLVRRVFVHDQNYLSTYLTQKPFQKSNEHPCVEALLEHHEAKSPPVGDGGNHIAAEALTCAGNHRRLTPPAPGASRLMVGSQAHLVPPVDLRPVALCPRPNRRIFLPKPLPHRLGVSLVRSSHGLLRAESPTAEVSPCRPHRNFHAKPVRQEFTQSLPGPKRERQLELVRATIGDQPHDRGRLMRLEPLDRRPPSPPRSQASKTPGMANLHPVVHRLARYAKGPRRLGLVHASPYRSDHAPAEVLLCRWRKKPRISFVHEMLYTISSRTCQILYALISKFPWRLHIGTFSKFLLMASAIMAGG